MIFDVASCEEIIGFSFKDKNLLRQCFTHASYTHEHPSFQNNERLEFFGDSVLGYCVSEYLYKNYPNSDEGALTEIKQSLVSHKPLCDAIRRLGLDEYVLYGEGERKNLENHSAACENLFEAIVAGIYLDEDGGLEKTKKFIFRELSPLLPKVAPEKATKKVEKQTPAKDSKSLLQEYVQKLKLGKIDYLVTGRKGPDHNPTFVVSLSVGGKEISSAEGNSKKEAEKQCAEKGLKYLTSRQKSFSAKSGKSVKDKPAVKANGPKGKPSPKTDEPDGKPKAKSGKSSAKKRKEKE